VSPGSTIVLLSLAGFAAMWPVGAVLRRRARLRAPFVAEPPLGHEEVAGHPHEHGADCGHPAVTHGDHVDYIHDGHRHAAHGGHYDEH
jgi:zinc transport system permease protein